MLVRQVLGGIDGVLGVFGTQIASCEVAAELLLERRDHWTVLLVLALITAIFQFITWTRALNLYLYLIIMLMGLLIVLVLMFSALDAGRARLLRLHAQSENIPPFLVRL